MRNNKIPSALLISILFFCISIISFFVSHFKYNDNVIIYIFSSIGLIISIMLLIIIKKVRGGSIVKKKSCSNTDNIKRQKVKVINDEK